jgi:hypothetical protein
VSQLIHVSVPNTSTAGVSIGSHLSATNTTLQEHHHHHDDDDDASSLPLNFTLWGSVLVLIAIAFLTLCSAALIYELWFAPSKE